MSDQPASTQNTPFVPEMTELFANAARGLLQSANDRIRIVSREEEIVSGIRSIPSPGHTPGHICCAVESRGRQMLLTGDAFVFHHTSFEHPDWHFFGDLAPMKQPKAANVCLTVPQQMRCTCWAFTSRSRGLGMPLNSVMHTGFSRLYRSPE